VGFFIPIYTFFDSHREEITAERLTPFRVFIIANPREKFTPGEVTHTLKNKEEM
jgi:hypothetical protein